jgi:hypothetical protein
MSETETSAKKIVFTGLDNSGKTSIISALESARYIRMDTKPTTFIERTSFKFLDYDIVSHDLGGQKKYLIKYLKTPDKFFDNTDICIFVIDIQDIGRLGEVLEYTNDLLYQFEAMGLKPKIYFFIHKAEKVLLEGDLEGAQRIELLKSKITEIDSGRNQLQFRTTTIYDPWTITTAFSDIFQDLYPKDVLVNKIMEEFATRLNADAIVLLDRRIITVASFERDEKYKSLIQFCAPYIFTFSNSLGRFQGVEKSHLKVELDNYEFVFTENKEVEPKTFLFLLGKKGQIPPLDTISAEISAILPELLASLRVALPPQ